MKTVSKHVSRSALVAYKGSADVVSKSVMLLVTVAAARVLAPEAFGVLALAMTTGWILGVASDAGLPLYLARSLARGDGVLRSVIRDVMRLRVRFALAALIVGLAIAAVWAPRSSVAAFALIVTAQLAGAVVETLSHVYRGLGRSEIESTLTIGHRLLTAALASAVLIAQPTLLLLSIALVVPPLLALAVSFPIAVRLAGESLAPASSEGRPNRLRQGSGPPKLYAKGEGQPLQGVSYSGFTRDAAPIGLGILISAVYFRCDVYFINYWHGLDTVGMYNAVFRLVEATRLLPAAALAVVFPELCRTASTRPVKRLAIVLGAIGALGMAFTFTTAPGIVHLIYGEAYLPAAEALRVLSLSLPLFFVNYALTHQVIAWDGQRRYLAITCAALVGNVSANLMLIPSHGMIGAAWATFLTELVVTAGCLVALRTGIAGPAHGPVPFLAESET